MNEIRNDAAERACLGAALSGSPQVDDAADMLQGRDFAHVARGDIWDTCVALVRDRQQVSPAAVAGRLSPRQLDAIGGAGGLAELISIEACPNPAYLKRYAEEVLDAALRRRIATALPLIREEVAENPDATSAAENVRRMIDDATLQARTVEGGSTIGDSIDEAIDWLEVQPVGADTPWPDVNRATNGLLAGQMITVAARPGHGKSLVAKDVAVRTAQEGKAVHIATLEMSRNEYLARIFAGSSGVDLGRMLRRELDDREWSKIAKARKELAGLPIYLDDRPSQTMAQVRSGARTTRRRLGDLGLIAIDYAQLVTPHDRRVPREQQVAEISRQTKLLAKEFECPVLLLAQLNRGNTQRSDHTPIVSDLRESGALEQDSDQVWLLHRPDQYSGGEDRLGEVDLIVGKNRNGPAPTTIPLAFQGHLGRVTSFLRSAA